VLNKPVNPGRPGDLKVDKSSDRDRSASQQVGYRRRAVLFANIIWNTYHIRILRLVGLIVIPILWKLSGSRSNVTVPLVVVLSCEGIFI
jgi:hypothetical protein